MNLQGKNVGPAKWKITNMLKPFMKNTNNRKETKSDASQRYISFKGDRQADSEKLLKEDAHAILTETQAGNSINKSSKSHLKNSDRMSYIMVRMLWILQCQLKKGI